MPTAVKEIAFATWPTLARLFPVHYSGLNENRQNSLIADNRGLLEARMKRYFDSAITDDELKEECPGLMTPAAGYDPKEAQT